MIDLLLIATMELQSPSVEIHGPVAPTLTCRQSFIGAPTEPRSFATVPAQTPEALIESAKFGKTRYYIYRLIDGNRVAVRVKLHSVPDLRPYEQRHPLRHWVQQAASRWESVLGCGAASAGIAVGVRSIAGRKL